jgi:hypothetical protein
MRSDQVMDSPDDMADAYRVELRRLLDAVDSIPPDLLSAPIHGDWTIKELLVHLARLGPRGGRERRRRARRTGRASAHRPPEFRASAGGSTSQGRLRVPPPANARNRS